MSQRLQPPVPRLTVITLGVGDIRASTASMMRSALRAG